MDLSSSNQLSQLALVISMKVYTSISAATSDDSSSERVRACLPSVLQVAVVLSSVVRRFTKETGCSWFLHFPALAVEDKKIRNHQFRKAKKNGSSMAMRM